MSNKRKGLSSRQMSGLHWYMRNKGYKYQTALYKTGIAKALSKKFYNSKWKQGKFKRDPYLDYDGDGKVNKYDCRPFDKNRQDSAISEWYGGDKEFMHEDAINYGHSKKVYEKALAKKKEYEEAGIPLSPSEKKVIDYQMGINEEHMYNRDADILGVRQRRDDKRIQKAENKMIRRIQSTPDKDLQKFINTKRSVKTSTGHNLDIYPNIDHENPSGARVFKSDKSGLYSQWSTPSGNPPVGIHWTKLAENEGYVKTADGEFPVNKQNPKIKGGFVYYDYGT